MALPVHCLCKLPPLAFVLPLVGIYVYHRLKDQWSVYTSMAIIHGKNTGIQTGPKIQLKMEVLLQWQCPRVTACDVITHRKQYLPCGNEFTWKFTRLVYKCVPYSSHSYSSSEISVHMDALPLASLCKMSKTVLQSEWFSLNLPCRSECHRSCSMFSYQKLAFNEAD